MERHERHVGRQGGQAGDEAVVDVDVVDLVAQAPQRLLDALAGLQRHLPLEGPPALQDRDAHQAVPRRRPAVRSGTMEESCGASGVRASFVPDRVEPPRGRAVPAMEA
ncbi:unannotated protein [freshwater metagenome]|uniref:Unannotated protein n=1 Tax=freshwater metagenome TaxID=449393 RepID=A0A6J7IDP8_9ZZZZ